MLHSPAINVVTGLIFIYLLYSLFATVTSELIATFLGLRARNLKEAIDRMLCTEKEKSFLARIWDSMKLMKNPDNSITRAFYKQPEIRQSGGSGIFRSPSAIKTSSFSGALMGLMFGNQPYTARSIEEELGKLTGLAEGNKDIPGEGSISGETAVYLRNLWYESGKDPARFRSSLEEWFDRSMDQATEWYRRKIRIVLLLLGFSMAWLFDADTFDLARNLSVDRDAREKLVALASSYIENNRFALDTTTIPVTSELNDFSSRIDSLLSIKQRLETDMVNAGTVLGRGGWLPDSISVSMDLLSGEKSYNPGIDARALSLSDRSVSSGKIGFSCLEKTAYLFRLLFHHFFGYLVTAIAISLGAPFWFDLLNKLMHLRTSPRMETEAKEYRNTDAG